MPTRTRDLILPHPGEKLEAYANALVSVAHEVAADPTNNKLVAAFVELLPAAAFTILEMTMQREERM
jgi:hypothetical protein